MIKLIVTCGKCQQAVVTNPGEAATVDEAVIAVNVLLREQRWVSLGRLTLCPLCGPALKTVPA